MGWLYQWLIASNSVPPGGMLARFKLASLLNWPTIAALVVLTALYMFAAQQWLIFALQLWLGYASGVIALTILCQWQGARPAIWYAAVALICGAALGTFIASLFWFWAIGFGTFRWWILRAQWWPPFVFGIVFCAITMVRDFVQSERAIAQRAQQAMERQRQESAKQAAEAQLRLLQAQIEPHFLLNTLANVRSLVKRDTDRARDMLDHLSDYLHVALPRMRQNTSTLEREAALSASFLSIMQIRMGARLAFSFDIPAELEHIAFPPMLLQTLVENAIKHGLEPSAQPGHIQIVARLVTEGAQDLLRVTVTDTGVGFGRANTSGTRIGLVNIRERLQSLYAGQGALEIAPNQPTGVIASVTIPAAEFNNK
jgi:signal transduction histidine kinase